MAKKCHLENFLRVDLFFTCGIPLLCLQQVFLLLFPLEPLDKDTG